MDYNIITETDEYIVVNKPAGMLVHGAEHIKKETSLIEEIIKKYPSITKIGDDPLRPGIMHRLDKLVSGLLVVAKTQDSFDNLKNQFKNRQINKNYIALVYGKITKDEDEINFPIKRSSKGFKMAALPKTRRGEANTDGRKASTSFIILKKYINYTLLSVQTKTGRTHQIRVHMAAYGHPLVGDDLYGTKKTRIKNAKLNLGRIFLIANKLEFKDLSGQTRRFEVELPQELTILLNKIK